MLAAELLPWLERTCGRGAARALGQFHLAGLSESAFADRAGDWMARDADPRMGVTAHEGLLRVSLRATAETSEAARERLEARMREFRERFAEDIYSEDDPRPAHALGPGEQGGLRADHVGAARRGVVALVDDVVLDVEPDDYEPARV